MAAAITRWAGSIHVLRSTAGGNPINCFKLVPCKTGTFLENGLVAPMLLASKKVAVACSLLGNCDYTLGNAQTIQSGALPFVVSAYSTARHTCGKVTMGDLIAAISSNWHHGGGSRANPICRWALVFRD